MDSYEHGSVNLKAFDLLGSEIKKRIAPLVFDS
jgi:hypothetical protein